MKIDDIAISYIDSPAQQLRTDHENISFTHISLIIIRQASGNEALMDWCTDTTSRLSPVYYGC